MVALWQGRRLKNKTVPIIGSPSCLVNVETKICRRAILDKFIVDIELNFYADARIFIIHYPTGDRSLVSLIQPTAKIGISRCEIESNRSRCDQQRLGNGF